MKTFFVLLITSFSCLMSYAQTDSTDYWISTISNRQLFIDRNYIGPFLLALSSGAAKLNDIGKPAAEKLVSQLTDEDKGIICHYILSNIYRRANHYNLEYVDKSYYRYNGLLIRSLKTGFRSDSINLLKCKKDWIDF